MDIFVGERWNSFVIRSFDGNIVLCICISAYSSAAPSAIASSRARRLHLSDILTIMSLMFASVNFSRAVSWASKTLWILADFWTKRSTLYSRLTVVSKPLRLFAYQHQHLRLDRCFSMPSVARNALSRKALNPSCDIAYKQLASSCSCIRSSSAVLYQRSLCSSCVVLGIYLTVTSSFNYNGNRTLLCRRLSCFISDGNTNRSSM